MWLLWIIIGFIFGVMTRFIKSSEKKSKYIRRGIMIRQYQVSTMGTPNGTFEVQFEVGELERTDKKSKVETINCIPSGTQHSDTNTIEKVKKLVDKSWIDSSDIEWITESISDKREEKLEKLLK